MPCASLRIIGLSADEGCIDEVGMCKETLN